MPQLLRDGLNSPAPPAGSGHSLAAQAPPFPQPRRAAGQKPLPCLSMHVRVSFPGLLWLTLGTLHLSLSRIRPLPICSVLNTSADSCPVGGGPHTHLYSHQTRWQPSSFLVPSVPHRSSADVGESGKFLCLEAASSPGDQSWAACLSGEHRLPDGPQKAAEV